MRRFEGTKKCAYCGKELTQDEIKDYLELDDKIINDIINNNNEMMDYIGKTI